MHFIAFQTIDFPRKTIQNTNHFWEINSLIETIGGKNEPKGARVVLILFQYSNISSKYYTVQIKPPCKVL